MIVVMVVVVDWMNEKMGVYFHRSDSFIFIHISCQHFACPG